MGGEGTAAERPPSNFDIAYALNEVAQMGDKINELKAQIAALEHDNAVRGEVDARRSSVDLSAKAGGFGMKFYFDPFAPPEVNDRALAELCRAYRNAHGVFPDGCTKRTMDLADQIEAEMALKNATPEGAKIPEGGVGAGP